MNIAIIIRRFDFGGAENYVRELANNLVDNDNEVFVFSGKGRQRGLLSPKVNFRYVILSKWLLPFNLLYLLVHLKKHNAEIIHAQQPSAIRIGCLLGKLSGIPVVVTIHSTTPLELRTEFTRNIPTRIIYISRYTMERSAWYSKLQLKCRYIPNGIMSQEYKPPNNRSRLIYCSRTDKSHAALLKLLITEVMPVLKNIMPNLSLEIYGDGNWIKQIDSWARNANKLLGAGTVVVRGFIEQFSANGFLVIGIGRVALEALSSGIPVLAMNANRCGPRISSANYDILSLNNFVDVTAQKPRADAIIESITDIDMNYQEVFTDSQNLREKVNKDFCLSKIVNDIQQEYKDAVSERSILQLGQKAHNKIIQPTATAFLFGRFRRDCKSINSIRQA